jgi:hypothetical protein
MSNYSKVEVNLLPPELLPPPAVRTSVILNFLIVIAALTYIGLVSYMTLNQIPVLKQDIADSEAAIAAKQPIVATYQTLVEVRENVDSYGRLVSLASVDYVEVPILLDRLARIIPEGVYLKSVGNDKPAANSRNTIVQVTLVASQDRPELIETTLDSFKRDTIFHDSYMRDVELRKETLNAQLPSFGVNWTASGPNIPDVIPADRFEFTILANVKKPVDASLPVVSDQSVYLADIEFKTPPPPADDEKGAKGRKRGAKGGAQAREPGTQAADKGTVNAPEGVTAKEVN